MVPIYFLHIIYIFELIITNRFTNLNDSDFFIKFLIFFLFLTFLCILRIYELRTNNYKNKYNYLYYKNRKYINDCYDLINKNHYLIKQLNNFKFPYHLKKVCIDYLNQNNYKCPICLNDIENNERSILTLCGHLFHHNCLYNDDNNSDKCPTCRTFIGNNIV